MFIVNSCLNLNEIAKFMFKIDKNMQPKNLQNFFAEVTQIHNRNTRSSHNNKLYLPKYRFNHLQRSIKYRSVKIWNKIPSDLINHFLSTFLKKYKLISSFHTSINFIWPIECVYAFGGV